MSSQTKHSYQEKSNTSTLRLPRTAHSSLTTLARAKQPELSARKPKTVSKKSNSRKKEESWSNFTKRHAAKGASWLWDFAWRRLFGSTLRSMAVLQNRIRTSEKTDWQYFDKCKEKVDESDTTKLLKTEFSLLSQSIRTSVGMRPMRVTIRIPFTLTATVTTGVVNTAVSVVPGSSGEFASLAGIFNEYKCLSGDVEFANFIRSSYAAGTTAATLNTSMLALVYDADSTALTSVINGTEYAQHALYSLGQQAGSETAVVKSPHHFHFAVTPGVGVDTVSGSVETGAWAPTSSNTTTYGFIKSYCVATEVTAIAVVVGVVHCHCEFRIRE